MGLHEELSPDIQSRRSMLPVRSARPASRRSADGDRAPSARPSHPPYLCSARITHIDRAIIRSFFQGSAILPHERRATRRQPTLPRLLSARVRQSSLPLQLESKLSLLPKEFERVLVGRDVLLVESETGTVIDILHQLGTANA